MNMVEKVARAMMLMANDVKSDEGWPMLKDYARAAIEAMREPTDAMEDAAYKHDDSGAQLSCGYGEIYTVMITAALEEK